MCVTLYYRHAVILHMDKNYNINRGYQDNSMCICLCDYMLEDVYAFMNVCMQISDSACVAMVCM